MTREIKFRAWSPGGKKMQTPSEKWEGDVFIRLNGEKVICIDTGEWEEGYKTDFVKDNLGLVLMQFTGVKDKNGKEIYEGDIVVSKHGNKIPAEVKYGFIPSDHDGEFPMNLCFNLGDVCVGKDIEGNENFLEVIGNKFENPELLVENPV